MEFGILDWILLIVFLIALLLAYGKYKIDFFQRKGAKTLPAYPFVGNLLQSFTRKEHFVDIITRAYNTFPEEKYVGFLQCLKPNLVVKDLEIIKQITIKDFEYFQDHQIFVDENSDPLFGKNLLSLKGQKWREMRATLSPAFTSSKMKQMLEYVAECGEQMANYYLEKVKNFEVNEKDGKVLEIELKDAFTRYANDVIATSAFGIKVDSLKDQENEFYLMGKKATSNTAMQIIKSLFLLFFPKLTKLLGITVFEKKLSDFFRNIVKMQIKYREENNYIRKDMIHLLMEAKKGSLQHESEKTDGDFAAVEESKMNKDVIKKDLDDDDITAQAILFFLAGFDTSSTVLSFLVNELAINPDIQKRLQCEIDDVCKNLNGKLEYNELQSMKYMDMVVSETLRKWPPGFLVDRVCVKPYKLPLATSTSKSYTVNPGDGIWIPVYSIHRDSKYFQNPEKFDPERFSDDNKSSILPFSYLPFGHGPRNCIGSRFALMEVKSVIFHLLKNFDFIEIAKTSNPLILDPKDFRMIPMNGFWVGLKHRH